MKKKKLYFSILLSILIIFSTFLYGYRVIILTSINLIAAHLTEYCFKKKKMNTDILITSMLYTLILPPHLAYHLSVFGIVFAVFIGKLVYGGSGYNIFNPALVGRIFLHVSFNKEMTTLWTKPITESFGGFIQYIGVQTEAVSSATPLLTFRWTGIETPIRKLFFGFTEGSIGETSALIIIFIGLILLIKKIISFDIVMSILLTYIAVNVTCFYVFNLNVQNPIHALFSGGLLFGTFLMATDPVTSPKSKFGKYIYGFLIGLISFLLRTYGLFAGGIMFAILFGNMMSPILDVVFLKKTSKAVKDV